MSSPPTMTTLHIDFETRSELDLPEVGLYNYARHPSTDVWCMAWALDEEPPALWHPGVDTITPLDHVAHGGTVIAHNAPFELAIWNSVMVPRYGWPELKPEQTRCTLAQAYAMGLPGNLEDAALAVGLPINKDAEGRALMLRMCRPRSVNPTVWWSDEDKLKRLYAYCEQDVRVERELGKRLMPLSEKERKVWMMDYLINQRGVAVDVPTSVAAAAMTEKVKDRCSLELTKITGGTVQTVTALAALKEWMATKGVAADSLAKQALTDLLETELPLDVRRALVLRQEAGKASTAKLYRLVTMAGKDNRLRNMYQYHGAATGRWAGRAVQTHNLPRDMPDRATVEKVLELVRDGNYDGIDVVYGPPMSMISKCLRSFFVAASGHVLVSGDFANVEGRGQAWFSGEQWKLDAFVAADNKTGPGIYELAYSRMFGVPVESVKNPSEERQVGKVCLAAGTPVVTDRGIVSIENVTKEDRLWDGQGWVEHSGLIEQGVRQTVIVDGVCLTPDHLVAIKQTWTPAQALATNASILYQALATGSVSLPWSDSIRDRQEGRRHWLTCSARAAHRLIKCTTTICAKVFQRVAKRVRDGLQAITGSVFGNTLPLFRTMNTGADCLTGYRRASTDALIQRTKHTRTTEGVASPFTNRGATTEASFLSTLSHLKAGMSRRLMWTGLMLIAATSRATYDLYLGRLMRLTKEACVSCKNVSKNLKPVYDLANAGPRRRFTIQTRSGFLIVHNCELAFGYQGGVGSFHVMAKTYGVKVSDAKADEFKHAWRQAHPKIVATWYAIQRAAINAVRRPGEVFDCGHPGRQARFKVAGSFLWCLLPSGRAICFPYPKILEGTFGPQLTYMSVPSEQDKAKGKIIVDSKNSNNWARIGTYGGSLFNNIVQGFCRDLLADCMLACEAAGAKIVMHTHDDINIEVTAAKGEGARAGMQRLMNTAPEWAKGFPLYAKCDTMTRYGK